MKFTEGVLCNYLKAFPLEMARMFEAIEYIIGQGNGGDLLEPLARRSFRDKDKEYFNRLKKEALIKEDGLQILCSALLKWYESWQESFKNFNAKNAEARYQELPIHTWLHCLLTGQMPIYQRLIEEELVVIEKSKWNEVIRESDQAKKSISFIEKEEKSSQQNLIDERLLKLYEMDEDVQIKEKLFHKKVAFFLEKEWSNEQMEELKRKHHFRN